MTSQKIFISTLLIATLAVLAINGQANAGAFTNNADIKVKNGTTSDGEIIFSFRPKRGAIQRIHVPVGKDWDERRIARQIEVVLNNEIGANYRIRWNSRRKVEIIKPGKKVRFYIGLAGQTAKGVTISIDYD